MKSQKCSAVTVHIGKCWRIVCDSNCDWDRLNANTKQITAYSLICYVYNGIEYYVSTSTCPIIMNQIWIMIIKVSKITIKITYN